ncbi:MAG: hypothetical protein RR215_00915 [Ruthenibacterium sp.]
MMPVLILNKTAVSMQRQRGVFLVGGRVSNRMDTKDVILTSTEKEHMGTVHEGACEVIEKPRSIDFILCSGAFLRRKKSAFNFGAEPFFIQSLYRKPKLNRMLTQKGIEYPHPRERGDFANELFDGFCHACGACRFILYGEITCKLVRAPIKKIRSVL